MLNLKVAIAQTNPIVGDFSGNSEQIKILIAEAADQKCDLVLFGELALTGYPLGDLSYRQDIIAAAELALEKLVAVTKTPELQQITVLLGHVARANLGSRHPQQQSYADAHNSVSVFRGGKLIGRYDKQALPNYDVFDDWRNFVPGDAELIFEVNGTKCAVAICEDVWLSDSPRGAALVAAGVELLLVANGSPFARDKPQQRRDAVKNFAPKGISVAYANLIGGQDELVFDGDSFFLDEQHREIARAAAFQEQLLVVDPSAAEIPEPTSDDLSALWNVLVCGLRDYARKTGQRRVILGLSGGIDSALSAALAAEALGPENVLGVALPSRYSSDHSLTDAAKLASNLGIEYRVISIEKPHLVFEGLVELSSLAEENLQARIRAVILMAISNSEGYLLLSTGNKSEIAVGYSTIYGDAAGGFAPIKDVYKTDVWRLSKWLNASSPRELIPENSISKPPSAELRPGQQDQDSLPDYEILDEILQLLVEESLGVAKIVELGHAPELVARVDAMVRRSEWKRSQGAIGTKTSKVSFGRGRRVPIATRFEDFN